MQNQTQAPPNRLKQFLRWLQQGAGYLDTLQSQAIVDRAISAYRLMEKIWAALPYDEYLVDVLVEGDSFTAIVFDEESNLWMRQVVLNGDDVSLGEAVRVTESYEALPQQRAEATRAVVQQRGTLTVTRQADGSYRWLARGCASVLNRVLEIDSSALFDCFVDRFNERPKPYLTLRHNGKSMQMGEADYIARDGNLLVGSGLFDPDPNNVLARAAEQALQRNASYWGISIGYELEDQDAPPVTITQKVRANGKEIDLPIPVFNEGTLIEFSMLGELDCASFFTSMQRMEVLDSMTAQRKARTLQDDLLQLFNGDKAAVETFLAGNDDVNRSIDSNNLIRRDAPAEANPAAPAPASAPAPAPDAPLQATVEMDDATLAAVVAALRNDPSFVQAVAAQAPAADMEGIRNRIAQMTVDVATLADVVQGVVEVQEELDEQFAADSPARTIRLNYKGGQQGTNRPSQRANKPAPKAPKGSAPQDEDVSELLAGVLDSIPSASGTRGGSFNDGDE